MAELKTQSAKSVGRIRFFMVWVWLENPPLTRSLGGRQHKKTQIRTSGYAVAKTLSDGYSCPPMATASKSTDEMTLRLGRTIAKIRKEKELSQETLAYEAEISRTSVNRVEIGEMNPSVQTLAKLCKPLQMSVSELLSRAEI